MFRQQVNEWLRLLADTGTGGTLQLRDVEELAISIFRSLGKWIDVRAIDQRLVDAATADLSGVQTALRLIEKAPNEPIADSVSSLHDSLRSLEEELSRPLIGIGSEDLEIPASFSKLDQKIEQALLSIPDRWSGSPRLVALVRERIETLNASAIQKIWTAIQRECNVNDEAEHIGAHTLAEGMLHPEDNSGFLVRGSRTMPRNFFAAAALPRRKDRIAEYTAWLRSRLYRDSLRRGRRCFPPDQPLGLARALCLQAPGRLNEPTDAERTLARSLGSLCNITSRSARLYRGAESLLSLDQRGAILGQLFRSLPPVTASQERTLLVHLLNLLIACEEILGDVDLPRIHTAERAFLHLQRLIVADPDVRARWLTAFNAKNGEVACERLGGAHLLHHGIYAIKSNAAGERTDLVLGTRLVITSKIQRASDAMALTEWKRVRGRVTLDAAVRAARKQALRYAEGALAGFEISTVRFLVTVSRDVLDEQPDDAHRGVVFRHVNIAVSPTSPSVRSRRAIFRSGHRGRM